MTPLSRSLLLTGALLLAGAATAPAAEAADPYQANLARAVAKYPGGQVPVASVRWLAKTFGKSFSQVTADLRTRGGGAAPTPAPAKAAPDPDVEIPEAALGASPKITGAYLHALEDVLAKYGGPDAVPEGSRRYLGKRHGKTALQVRVDLRQVDASTAHLVLPPTAY